MAKHLLLLPLLPLALNFIQSSNPRTGKIVETRTGKIQGIISKSRDGRDFYQWLGIPYAQPPVGALRYASPQPAERWDRVKRTTKNPPKCAQIELLTWRFLGEEDCLYLNVHVPKLGDKDELPKGLPVMIWLHPGGFNIMGADDYRPEYFMDQDVILVVTNFRLGNFGFLSTGDSVVRGNMGLKDQLLALKWVNDNIESFGGDPKRITIFGESGGSSATHYQMLSTKARGLFSKVISQSGTASSPFAIDTPETAKKMSLKFAKSVGCNFVNSTEMVNCLRGLSKTELLQASLQDTQTYSILKPHLDGHWLRPTVEAVDDDEAFITEHPLTIVEQGKATRVPWLTGVVADEGLLSSIEFYRDVNSMKSFEADWEANIARTFALPREDKRLPEIADKIRQFYFLNNGGNMTLKERLNRYTEMFGDAIFNLHLSHTAAIQRQHSPVYLYHYNYRGGPSLAPIVASVQEKLPLVVEVGTHLATSYVRSLFGQQPKYYGISHSDDVAMFFIVPGLFRIPKNENDPKKRRLYLFSKDLVKLWVDFAMDKNDLEFRGWSLLPVKREGPLEYLEISENPKIIRAPFENRVSFLQSLNILGHE